ncbi:MAG: hypothetical protein JJ866_16750 [Roseibium sp.]|uniref:hypothetical protein n=1 Tax=Roseibium sp. TaxID=1936156 RepID=UPI001B1B8434|nr:hypothetical protein [Roseibium sp.]MBO6893593.1 hypothetical protein [Roseibium sp.]MBO6930249.1 hypothetical protein [Roseibium sp.]
MKDEQQKSTGEILLPPVNFAGKAQPSRKEKKPAVPRGKTAAHIEFGSEKIDVTNARNLPNDRQFRDAWQLDGDAVEIDLVEARKIKREQLRQERNPILAGLDVDWMRASEQAEQGAMTVIAALKQRYRDATNHAAIEEAVTADELASITLESLVS